MYIYVCMCVNTHTHICIYIKIILMTVLLWWFMNYQKHMNTPQPPYMHTTHSANNNGTLKRNKQPVAIPLWQLLCFTPWPKCHIYNPSWADSSTLGVWPIFHIIMEQFSSVAQSCLTLCDPMNHSTPGLPVHYQLLESTQTHIMEQFHYSSQRSFL